VGSAIGGEKNRSGRKNSKYRGKKRMRQGGEKGARKTSGPQGFPFQRSRGNIYFGRRGKVSRQKTAS